MINFDKLVASFVLLALALSIGNAYDPSPLQDFCVATNEPLDGVYVNGQFCKDPKLVTVEEFVASGFNMPKNTNNTFGFNVTVGTTRRLPGLSTLGIFLASVDFAPNGGLFPPHTHPRASEIFFVMKGRFYSAFVTGEGYNYTVYEKILEEGEGMVIPLGLVHFQMNIGKERGVAINHSNSQDPGLIFLADALFDTRPPINASLLARALKIRKSLVKQLQSNFQT